MASSTLTPYNEDAAQTTYSLQSTSAQKTRFVVTGRSLARPQLIEIERKFAPNGSGANDHVILRSQITEQSTLSPYKPCTFSAVLDLSIPRDQTGVTTAIILKQIAHLCSLLRMGTAMSTTNANNTNLNALISGNDL